MSEKDLFASDGNNESSVTEDESELERGIMEARRVWRSRGTAESSAASSTEQS